MHSGKARFIEILVEVLPEAMCRLDDDRVGEEQRFIDWTVEPVGTGEWIRLSLFIHARRKGRNWPYGAVVDIPVRLEDVPSLASMLLQGKKGLYEQLEADGLMPIPIAEAKEMCRLQLRAGLGLLPKVQTTPPVAG